MSSRSETVPEGDRRELFPEKITQWRCPVCGMLLNGRTYNVEPSKTRCTAGWHKAKAVRQDYARVPANPHLEGR